MQEKKSRKLFGVVGFFVLVGAIILTVVISKQQQEIRQRASGSNLPITVSLTSQGTSIPLGGTQTVNINLDTHGQAANGFQFTITFANTNPPIVGTAPQIAAGIPFDDCPSTWQTISATGNQVTINLACSTNNDVQFTGTIASFTLQAPATATTPANITLQIDPTASIVSDSNGADQLKTPTNPAATYTIGTAVNTPTPTPTTGAATPTLTPAATLTPTATATPSPTTAPTLNSITANLFYDYNIDNPTATTNRNGARDAGEVAMTGFDMNLKNSFGINVGFAQENPAGVFTFPNLQSGQYTIVVNGLSGKLDPTNPAALTVTLQPNNGAVTTIGLAPKPGMPTDNSNTAHGYISGGDTAVDIGSPAHLSAVANYLAPFWKVEAWRVKTNATNLADQANWHLIGIKECTAFGGGCNPATFAWTPITTADVGLWYTFINIYSWNGTKCSGNPQVASMPGFADCSGLENYQDVIQTEVRASTVTPTATVTISPFLAADVNHDNCVDLVDFNDWLLALTGHPVAGTFPDINGSGGTPDIIDYNLWLTAIKNKAVGGYCQ